MSRVFLLALTAALNPTLLTATTVLLLLPNPKRMMLGYLAGAFTTGMVVGIVVVEWLSDSGAATDTKQAVSPAIDLAFGLLALIAAYVIQSGAWSVGARADESNAATSRKNHLAGRRRSAEGRREPPISSDCC